MEQTGFEPVASSVRGMRSPNCATAPKGGESGIRTHGDDNATTVFETVLFNRAPASLQKFKFVDLGKKISADGYSLLLEPPV